jgi:hypothetical protein
MAGASSTTISSPTRMVVRVAGLGDIIASKEWANRPKDREALPELHELRDRAARPPDSGKA